MQLFPATYDRPRTRNTFRYTVHAQRHRTVAVAQYLERHVEMRSPAPELNFAPDGLVGFAASARSDGESDQTVRSEVEFRCGGSASKAACEDTAWAAALATQVCGASGPEAPQSQVKLWERNGR